MRGPRRRPSLSTTAQAPPIKADDEDEFSGAQPDSAPEHALYSTETKEKLAQASNIAHKAIEIIKQIPDSLQNDQLKSLLANAERRSKFDPSNTKTVGVLGDSGEGNFSPTRTQRAVTNLDQARVASSIPSLARAVSPRL
jgi:hypothetical protein